MILHQIEKNRQGGKEGVRRKKLGVRRKIKA
jgi:hypothetical protein